MIEATEQGLLDAAATLDHSMHLASARYFGHCTEVYRLRGGVKHGELSDAISARVKQLSAATLAIHGEGFDAFECMAPDIRENYLWMVHSMVAEVRDLWDALRDVQATSGR